MKKLNKREQKVWEYIIVYEVDNGVVPSNTQIAKHLKLNFTRQYIKELVDGVLKNKGFKAENNRLLKKLEVVHSS